MHEYFLYNVILQNSFSFHYLSPSLSCHSLVLPQKYFVADDFVTYFLSPRVDVVLLLLVIRAHS